MQPAALEQALGGFQTSKHVQHVNTKHYKQRIIPLKCKEMYHTVFPAN